MPGTQTIKKIITSNYYKVSHDITLKMGQSVYKTLATFNVFIKKLDSLKYDIFLDRSNFKINGEEVESKFIYSPHLYFSCLFPLRFKIQKNELVVVNFTEVMARITEKDLELKEEFDNESLSYTRQQFLDQVDTANKLQNFVSSLSIIKIIGLSLHRFAENLDYRLLWQTPPVTSINYMVTAQNNNNIVTYKGENTNKTLFINQLNVYNQKNNLKLIADNNEDSFTATFIQNVNYQGDTLGFIDSQTIVKTSLGNYFDYQENISLLARE
jgi:hypothetical protein